MNELQPWMYTILFGLLAILIIGNNLWVLIQSKIKKESTSFTIFIGALFGVVSLLAAPIPSIKVLAFIPILADPGTILIISSLIRDKKTNKI